MSKLTGKKSSKARDGKRSGRRAFLKGAAATAVAAPMVLTARKTEAQVVVPPSPQPRPWAETLPDQIQPSQAVSALDPSPGEFANTTAGECGRNPHFGYTPYLSGKTPVYYRLRAGRNSNWSFNPNYPRQQIWGWHDMSGSNPQYTSPGPTFFFRYGQPVITRIYNDLPQDHVGFGTPEISTHLHNGHTPSESDGFPGDFFSPLMAGPTLTKSGYWRDHFYPNICAGYDTYPGGGDHREALGTLFYHDHCLDFTAPNVQRGLLGMTYLFDHIDSGDERDASSSALRLPSHPYDYPIALADKRFNNQGVMIFDQIGPEGTLGDITTVNGKVQPVLNVAKRKYRFRILNGGPSRFYHLVLVTAQGLRRSFQYIANDGNLLPAPLTMTDLPLGVAERGDIVVDFTSLPIGTVLYLENRQRQIDTRGPRVGDLSARQQLLKIVVNRTVPAGSDVSRVPSTLRQLPELDLANVTQTRRWNFERRNGQWAVNGKFVNVFEPEAMIPRGSCEIWEFENRDDGWSHPIHVHFEEGRILSKRIQGVEQLPPARELGRKDVFVLPPGPDTVVRVLLHFRDMTGKYVMHCHNMIHEDHAMMVRWDIVDP